MCRGGAGWVVGAEVSQAMCDVGVQTLVMNGYASQCIMLNKDVRHMEIDAKPDCTPADIDKKADIAIFEVSAVHLVTTHNAQPHSLKPKGRRVLACTVTGACSNNKR